MAKYIFVVGGVISGVGKGISSASIGLLLKLRGLNVDIVKFDPYLNVNAGIISPFDHGENFTLDDGTETDLDLGHYERITGISMTKNNICTAGTLYKEIIAEQESGVYLGQTVQIIPHLTNKIQKRLIELGKEKDVIVVEIGGTVGDIESSMFFEAICEFKHNNSKDVIIAMVAPILWMKTIEEFKTKPLQNSVRELRSYGLQPDLLFGRSEMPIPDKLISKISTMTNISKDCVFNAVDVKSIYQVPIEFYNRHVDDACVNLLGLKRSNCKIHVHKELVEKYINNNDLPMVNIGVFGKYANPNESYLSLKESLYHAGVANDVRINIVWHNSEDLEKSKTVNKFFEGLDGCIIAGGFDNRGVEGKIKAIKYARENNIPLLGICLGLQCAVIEFARNVCGLDANSQEFDINAPDPVVYYIKGQENIEKKSASMRLGAYSCQLNPESLSYELYGKKPIISERHRHRLEVNPKYIDTYDKHGFKVAGNNPESGLIEIMEYRNHPFFIGTQAHPELKSKLFAPAPLFQGLVAAAKNYKKPKVENAL